MEERSELRRPTSETTNSLSVSDRVRSIPGIFSGGGRRVLETLWFESECDPSPSRITRKSYGPRVPDRTMVAKFDRRSALLVSELTGFVAKKR